MKVAVSLVALLSLLAATPAAWSQDTSDVELDAACVAYEVLISGSVAFVDQDRNPGGSLIDGFNIGAILVNPGFLELFPLEIGLMVNPINLITYTNVGQWPRLLYLYGDVGYNLVVDNPHYETGGAFAGYGFSAAGDYGASYSSTSAPAVDVQSVRVGFIIDPVYPGYLDTWSSFGGFNFQNTSFWFRFAYCYKTVLNDGLQIDRFEADLLVTPDFRSFGIGIEFFLLNYIFGYIAAPVTFKMALFFNDTYIYEDPFVVGGNLGIFKGIRFDVGLRCRAYD